MADKVRVIGFVEGKRFNNAKEMVELIYREYYKKNPYLTFDEIAAELKPYNLTSINFNETKSFFLEESYYLRLIPYYRSKIYSPTPFNFQGVNYYLKIEIVESEVNEHIKFAKDHDIKVDMFDNQTAVKDIDVFRLKLNDKELINFYMDETKTALTEAQSNELSNLKLMINQSYEYYFEIAGRYGLEDIAEEVVSLSDNKEASDFRPLLCNLVSLLKDLMGIEYPINRIENQQYFTMPNSPYYVSWNFKREVKNKEREIADLFKEIESMLKGSNWPEETRKLIERVLKDVFPKIASRKRASVILGSFDASTFTVTLYKTAIKKWLPSVDLDKKMLDVYSHELFHAFHYVNMKDKNKWQYDDESRIVKESLARFIEYRYSLINICETAISTDLIRVWNDYDMLDFPYAGAKVIAKKIGFCGTVLALSSTLGTKLAFHTIESAV